MAKADKTKTEKEQNEKIKKPAVKKAAPAKGGKAKADKTTVKETVKVEPASQAAAKALPVTPKQKLGDTPVAPWNMATPKEKAAVEPVRDALKQAIAGVDTEAKADQVVDTLEAALGGAPAGKAARAAPKKSAATAAKEVKATAEAAPEPDKPAAVLAETAVALETATGRDREALAEAVQEVFNPEQQGEPTAYQRRRALLRKALIKRLKPMEALDANIFIGINHLPHSRFSNGLFYFITVIFGGGIAWYLLMAASMLRRRKWDRHMLLASALPLVIATALVEFPIKAIFRRRRPFITQVRAIVVGKKPGTFSFPSGHSASAFAGAWLLGRHFPAIRPLLYALAGLIAFSRVYLGDHYPGDVVTGSLLGHFFAQLFGWLLGHRRRRSPLVTTPKVSKSRAAGRRPARQSRR